MTTGTLRIHIVCVCVYIKRSLSVDENLSIYFNEAVNAFIAFIIFTIFVAVNPRYLHFMELKGIGMSW